MRNTSKIGNVTTAKVLAALMENGKTVLVPFGDGLRYDLLIDEGDRFVRVQCKTGKLKSGCVAFRNYSVTGTGRRRYGVEVDAFGVYCPQTKKCYLVPVVECAAWGTKLRVEPAKNGQTKDIRDAGKFEI